MRDLCAAWHTVGPQEVVSPLPDPPRRPMGEGLRPPPKAQFAEMPLGYSPWQLPSPTQTPSFFCVFRNDKNDTVSPSLKTACLHMSDPLPPTKGVHGHTCVIVCMCVHTCVQGPTGEDPIPHILQGLQHDLLMLSLK